MPTKFASGVSNSMDWEVALESIISQIRPIFDSASADLAILFTTGHFADVCVDISRRVNQEFSPGCFVGCTAGGVIGSDQEYEEQSAIALLVGSLPGCHLHPFHLTQQNLSGIGDEPIARQILGASPEDIPSFVLLPDPFSFDTAGLLRKLDLLYPRSAKVGGLASAGFQPGSNRLYLNEDTHLDGLVGFSLTGSVEILPIVSQGCRPIGNPLMITDVERNVIKTLGNHSAFEVLQEMVSDLSEEDQRLAASALLIGVVIDEYKTDFGRGDFLIRNLIGGDPENGYLVINDHVTPGQTIQFQVRDANTAEEELSLLLQHALGELGSKKPLAATVFNCNGRGLRLFPHRNHDIDMIQAAAEGIPSAGFFCAGEIGPVGGKTFIHGFTGSIGLFVPRDDTESE